MFADDFNIYTREAGAGSLSVAVEGPSKAQMTVDDRGHGYTTVSYKVFKEGKKSNNVRFRFVLIKLTFCSINET